MTENPTDQMLMNPEILLTKVNVSPKGVRTFVLDLDEYEIIETGTKEKEKDGKKIPVNYMTFKIIDPKPKV
jgi:hypothetical protein